MIFAQYKNDETAKLLTIEFSNTALNDAGYKPVNATYHLENAINKAFDGAVRPEKVNIKIADAHNHYLKVIAIAFVAYVRGLGYSFPDLTTENF
jgi:hypothetical protein